MYGCTTPYGPHKDQICKNKENGTKVFDKYVETIDGHKYDCKNPCKYIISRPFITSDLSNQPNINGQKVAYFKIYFKRNIKFTRAHYLYSELSLIAEIGGYFRLFLEVFVNNLSNGIFGIEIPKYVDILNGLGTSFALHYIYTLGYRRNYLSQK